MRKRGPENAPQKGAFSGLLFSDTAFEDALGGSIGQRIWKMKRGIFYMQKGK